MTLSPIASDSSARLVLGTAQLGAKYGIANQLGRPNSEQANNILELAGRGGIRILDTACLYGKSEAIIGQFLKHHPEYPFSVISKFDPATNLANGNAIEVAVQKSCDRIGKPLEGMLFHNAIELSKIVTGSRNALRACIDKGLTMTFGISVYTPSEFQAAIDEELIGIIQVPYNVFDKRIRDQGLLQRAANSGKRVFLRSIYLQGLLLMEPDSLPPAMAFAATSIANWRDICACHGLSPLQGALGFVRETAPGAWIVIGCESTTQLEDALIATEMGPPNVHFLAAVEMLRANDPRMIDPRTWG